MASQRQPVFIVQVGQVQLKLQALKFKSLKFKRLSRSSSALCLLTAHMQHHRRGWPIHAAVMYVVPLGSDQRPAIPSSFHTDQAILAVKSLALLAVSIQVTHLLCLCALQR